MQFITNGPDIPDDLLQAHEEGRLVFFCGAGISYPAGLRNFEWLVDQIYKLNGTTPSDIESDALGRGTYDATLDLLERRLPGQRLAVRRALAQVLKPNLRLKGATDTQQALLRLARDRKGALRLVTTNFDRIFHSAAKRIGQKFEAYSAPMLPIPKNSRWNGLVFLHGLLPSHPDETALNRLVLTSGDFGLAYLTERWAARFVSELFRNYEVCFVGYSINDPVLRYMMDALAADRMLGEFTPPAWALGDCAPGQEQDKTNEWEAKGVTPILYEVPAGSHDHSALHKTLRAWATVYRDGVLGKERIVVNHALARPSSSTQQDDFTGRMLWALSDKTGLPAKRFAEFNPVPPIDWLLEAFSDERFKQKDLPRFGVPPHATVEDKMRFSLIRRPAPYNRAPLMRLITDGADNSQWDDVMYQLARWLTRHLDDPRLIIWASQRGGHLHPNLISLIEQELDKVALLEREGRTIELDQIRANAPYAIPRPLIRKLWRLLASGRVKSHRLNIDNLYSWKKRLKRDGLTATLRLQLREILAPQVILRKPYSWSEDVENSNSSETMRQLVDWELVLATDHPRSAIKDTSDELWQSVLPQLVGDLQQLLLDALSIFGEMGEAENLWDRSNWDLPSIAPHWQNRGFHDWVILIELLRDAWIAVREQNSSRAEFIALSWFELPYPVFKRLAFFAASQDNCILSEQWVDWLLADDASWLWSTVTMREVYRLLVTKGAQLSGTDQERLESAILAGPPRTLFNKDLDADKWQNIAERMVWLHLAKLSSSRLTLGPAATKKFVDLSQAHPQWKLAENESDEFSTWMSGTGDPDYEESIEVDIAPRKRTELVQWLTKTEPKQTLFQEDTWRDVCRTRFFQSLFALNDLAQSQVWPKGRWSEALQVWSEEDLISRSWRYAAPLVLAMPDSVLRETARSVSWWMHAASKHISQHEKVLLGLADRILDIEAAQDTAEENNSDPVGEAINHPVGLVTQALIRLWFMSNPNDNDQLPEEIRALFSRLCDVRVQRFRHGRVILGSRAIALFRVDKTWSEKYLLPLFLWCNEIEAKAIWEGFLWSPRLHQPLLFAFKQPFLECAKHYSELGEHSQQYAAFLTYAALELIEGYSPSDFQSAIEALPQKGLEESAQALYQALEGAADQREDYWKNRVRPFWHDIWPKSRSLATPRMADSFARLAIAAGSEFPAALATVEDWLQPIEHPDYIVHLLQESDLCTRFPEESLTLLRTLITDQIWGLDNLKQCLDKIAQASPELSQDARLIRLYNILRIRGG